MNGVLRLGYEGAAQLARIATRFAPTDGGKLASSFAMRRGLLRRYDAFARDAGRPLVWMHAPSVGEGLQARPVLRLLRARQSSTQLAYTYFSPSAVSFARRLLVDFADFLPFDTTGDMQHALAALQPNALVFSKLDVWPTLARCATRRRVPLGLISATLAEGSSRRGTLAGALLRDAYARLDLVGAISRQDADRLIALGVPSSRVRVTGDTRFDQVWERATTKLESVLPNWNATDERVTVVAGSTWPADEAVLLEAWGRIPGVRTRARLIIAPHEPSAAHTRPIVEWVRHTGLTGSTIDDPRAADSDVVMVNRVGVLGDVYGVADLAYVGGAFHDAGLHSVLEPAAFGVPVLFGPRFSNSREASLLLDADGARTVNDVESLAGALEAWIADATARRAAGEQARMVVRAGLGASERSYELVTDLLR